MKKYANFSKKYKFYVDKYSNTSYNYAKRRERKANYMIKAGIIGATGYAGQELVRILLGHKEVEIKWYGSRSYIDKKYYEVYQVLYQNLLLCSHRL